MTRRGWMFGIAFVAIAAGCGPPPEPNGEIALDLSGQVEVNGTAVGVDASGSFDPRTGAYELAGLGAADAGLSARDSLLLSLIPRSALAFLGSAGSTALLDGADGPVELTLEARRKVDEVSGLRATVEIARAEEGVAVRFDGRITTVGDRPIEPDGEAVVRLGVNPDSRTFVGGARINYDVETPDPAALGTADFWNLWGSFTNTRAADGGFAHVDRCGGRPADGFAKGVVLRFPSSTVFEPGVITLSGVAQRDGVIHQYLGVANQTGGGRTLLTFPVYIEKGMTSSDVAGMVAEGFNRARRERVAPGTELLLAVQGGDGVERLTPDPTSSRVVVSMTLDGESIARPDDPRALQALAQVSTQAFSDQAVAAASNTGIRNQFGVLGEPPLTGWLTPFKAVFSTDNEATGFRAAGGEIAVLLNWSEDVDDSGGSEHGTTDFADLVLPTAPGESAEEIVARLTRALAGQRTKWGSHPFVQRDGNTLYVDAGIDFPHSVSLASRDEGVGYMSAAADLPFFAEGEPVR